VTAQNRDANTEAILLVAILERSRVLDYALPKMHEELFLPPFKEVFKRITYLISQGKAPASTRTMAGDPAISKAAQTALLSSIRRHESKANKFTKADVTTSIEILEYYRQVRILGGTAQEIIEGIQRSTKKADIGAIRAKVQEDLSRIDTVGAGGTTWTIGDGGNITEKWMIEQLMASKGQILPTGFRGIDDHIRGFRKSNVVLLTAMRGEGKSLLAKTLSLNHFYKDKKNVCIVNLEMAEWEYLLRLFAETGEFTHSELRQGLKTKRDIKRLIDVKRNLDAFGVKHGCRWTLRTVANPNYDAPMMHNELKYQGYDAVVVDYVNLLAARGSDLWHALHNAAQYIKMMAKDLDCLVYLLGQLNEEGRAKYAKALEEACDTWIYWRLDKDNPKEVDFKYGKSRDFEGIDFKLSFDGKKTRFVNYGDLDDPDEDEYGDAGDEEESPAEDRPLRKKRDRKRVRRPSDNGKESIQTESESLRPNLYPPKEAQDKN
jgi:replicative DNA helicase